MSSAWLTIQTSCSAGSRRLSVCSTAPIEGIDRYASTCSALFHMRVATRWSPSTPSSSRRACASWEARAPMSAKLRRCGSGSPVQVVTCDFPWMVIPWVRMRVTVSGTSCMVLSTASSRWALRGGKGALILLTYQAVCHYFREYESVSSGAGRQKGARNDRTEDVASGQESGHGSPVIGSPVTAVQSRTDPAHRTGLSSGSSRSLPSARETALLTVPTDTPITSAVCTSLRSS